MLTLLKYIKPFRMLIILGIVAMFGQAMAELYLPTIMSDIVNNGMMRGNSSYVLTKGTFMLLVALSSGLLAVAGSFLSAKIALGLGSYVRDLLFTKIESFSLDEFDRIGTASLITRTTNDITQIQMVVVMMFRFIIYAPIMCVGGIIMALSKDKQLTILLVIILPLMFLTISSIATFLMPLFRQMQTKVDKLNLVMRENLTGIRVIRAFNRINYESERFEKSNRELADISIRANKILALLQPVMVMFLNITSILIIWYGGIRIGQNNLDIGDMMAFMQYSMQIMFSIIMVSIMFIMIPRAQASAIRVNEVLEMEPEINDPANPAKTTSLRGYIEFKDVTFSYPGAEQPALKNISFTANPNETVAIIGGTGSGKTTLLNLIMRYYDVNQGCILADGIDVRHFKQADLRAKIGFVPQQAILFSGTVSENIRYGKNNASDEEVTQAAAIAQAIGFISHMPEGFNSFISQGGTNISGGQKQRLSIARALVRKPEIYLFDDSFSALDYKTDALLRKALQTEIRDATMIIVAQRVSTIMDADRIIVLDKGEIIAIDSHRNLLRECEIYREIVSSQLNEEEIA